MSSAENKTKPISTLPEINGDRCVHALIETASCRACVDVCPQQSWILDDESLGLDTSSCDGCGLCVPVCSEGAITQNKDCTLREENNKKVLLLACEYIEAGTDAVTNATNAAKRNHWKCVHAVSAHELLKLYHDGIHQIVVAKADCSACARGNSEHLSERVLKIDKMLRHSHLAPLHYNEITANQWLRLWKSPEQHAPGPEMSRRMFFRSAIKQSVEVVFHQTTLDSAQSEFKPLAKIIEDDFVKKGGDGQALYPAVPVINPEKCNGCDSCFRVCPHGALRFKIEEANNDEAHKVYYEIKPSLCSSCNICIDICEQDAITLNLWSEQSLASRVINLKVEKCHSCGTVFHYPNVAGATNTAENRTEEIIINTVPRQYCNICEKVNHQKNLFQVFD